MGFAQKAGRIFGNFDLLDKSFLTNLISVLLVIAGYISPVGQNLLKNMGWFALSGAITNWLAIYMLFERIPGLYGSGIVPLKFQEFKKGIRAMIMQQFFTRENIARFFGSQSAKNFESHLVLEAIDFELLLDKLVAAVQSTPFAPMLAMFGGTEALKGILRQPFESKMREALVELLQSDRFATIIKRVVAQDFSSDDWTDKIEQVVTARLEELTPDMVKDIIQEMIRSHLGWLVVWGGVFGALMGVVAGLLE